MIASSDIKPGFDLPEFLWDGPKSRSNKAKHGIDFDTASLAFDDPLALVEKDRVVDGELRFHLTGKLPNGRLALVVHTYAEEGGLEIIRIISARRATRMERSAYEERNR